MNERNGFSVAGIPFVGLCLVLFAIAAYVVQASVPSQNAPGVVGGLALGVITAFLLKGIFRVAPNQGLVLQLFGKYAGTARKKGLRWTNPFYTKQRISLRVRNFESGKLKVNDNDGNPIEIAAAVVWRVLDTAEAVFCVDD